MVGRLHHPNLVALKDAWVNAEGSPALVMEYVEGDDLRTRLEERPPDRDTSLRVVAEVFAALDAMHRVGIAHGDVKPENVRLTSDEAGKVKLVDFGRARLAHLFGEHTVFPGTPPYMHPSLYHGGAPDGRTDTFAGWVVLYELLTGRRPFSQAGLQNAPAGELPEYAPLRDPMLNSMVHAGLRGDYNDARTSWLCLMRHRAGRPDLPLPSPPRLSAAHDIVDRLLQAARRGGSVAVVGGGGASRAVLESFDRRWRELTGRTLWLRADWALAGVPYGGALALAGHLADALDRVEIEGVALALGPLADTLSNLDYAVRAWLPAPAPRTDRPPAERLELALRRMLRACPGEPVLVVEGVDRLDGSTRRLLTSMMVAGELRVIGSAAPNQPHGLAEEVALRAEGSSFATDWKLAPRHQDLLDCAGLLGLSFGDALARATGTPAAVVAEAALECEAGRRAIWTGRAVIPRFSGTLPPDRRQQVYREAADRLSADAEPLLVARYARLGGHPDRLAQVIDVAAAELELRDAGEALALLVDDPRPPTSARLLHQLRVALVARDHAAAERALARIKALEPPAPADLAEAEAELDFHSRRPSGDAWRRVAAALGRPVPEGLLGRWADLRSAFSILTGRLPEPRPDSRLARVFERLHDFHFLRDNAPMLRLRALWLAAAPNDPRARAMEVVWRSSFGRVALASTMEQELVAELQEERDPVGVAVVMLHRGIARVWRGEVTEAFADALAASDQLLRAGDPYLAALATTVVSTAGYHLAAPDPMLRVQRALERLVEVTGDERAAAWARGNTAVLRVIQHDSEGALAEALRWAEAAADLGESSEAIARRFVAEAQLERGELEPAAASIEACEAVIRRDHLQMDFTDAVVIFRTITDARLRLAGKRGLGDRWLSRLRLRWLLARSPRWRVRAWVAQAWTALADGDRARAIQRFEAAAELGQNLKLPQDTWFALNERARALDDDRARDAAALFRLRRPTREFLVDPPLR